MIAIISQIWVMTMVHSVLSFKCILTRNNACGGQLLSVYNQVLQRPVLHFLLLKSTTPTALSRTASSSGKCGCQQTTHYRYTRHDGNADYPVFGDLVLYNVLE